MSNLLIGDASVSGADVVLADGTSGLGTVSNRAILLDNVDNIIFDNLDLTWTGSLSRSGVGIYTVDRSDGVTVKHVTASNRSTGVEFNGGSSVSIQDSTFSNNDTGIIGINVIHTTQVNNSIIQRNTNGLQTNVAIDATNNFWGSAAGPGAGGNNGFTGSANATPFLVSAPAGAPPIPNFPANGPAITSAMATVFQVTTNADIADGVTSSIANLLANQGADNAISLREAILAANNTAGADVIGFAIGSGAMTIQLASVLPVITEAVTIDGATLITIDANALGGSIVDVTGVAVTLKDLKIANYAEIGVRLRNADNSVVQNVDLSNPSVYLSGTAVSVVSDSDNVSITGVTTTGAGVGIEVSGSANPTIQNNILSAAGDGLRTGTALFLNSVTGLVAGAVSGNSFNSASIGAMLWNMSGLTVGDAGVAGAQIVLADGTSGLSTAATGLYLRNLDNSVVNNVDVTWDGAGVRSGTGILQDSDDSLAGRSDALTITNVTATNRNTGMQLTGNQDLVVTSNTLLSNTVALYVENAIDGVDAGTGLFSASGNLFTGSDTGLKLWNMIGLTVGTVGTDVVIDNTTDGLKTVTSYALSLRNFDNGTIRDLDLTYAGLFRTGTGIFQDWDGSLASRTVALMITNVTATNRSTGIQLTGSQDLVVTSNNLSNNTTALFVDDAIDGADAGNRLLSASGNVITGSDTGLKFWNMIGLTIGTAGTDVVINITDNLKTVTGNVLSLRNFDNGTISDLDLTYAGPFRSGTGIFQDWDSSLAGLSDALMITNVTATNRGAGIQLTGSQDLAVTGNNLSNNTIALFVDNALDGGDVGTGPLSASDNVFTGSDTGLQLWNMTGVTIGTVGTDIVINNTSDGLKTVTGIVLYLQNFDNGTISNLDLTYAGPNRSGTGIYADSSMDNVTIQNVVSSNRNVGMELVGGATDLTLLNNTLTNNNTALRLSSISDGADANTMPVIASGNVVTGSTNGFSLNTLPGQFVGTTGTGIIINNATDGFTTLSGTALFVSNLTDGLIDGLELSWSGTGRAGTGISTEGDVGTNLVIQNVNASNRNFGVDMTSGGTDLTLNSINVSNSNTGMRLYFFSDGTDADTVPIVASGNIFTNSSIGLELLGCTGQFIGTSGAGIVINNATDGLKTTSTYGIYLRSGSGVTIDGLNVSYSGLFRLGFGIYADQGQDLLTIQNVISSNRDNGIRLEGGGQDLTVNNNNLSNNNTALRLASFTDGDDADSAPFSGFGNTYFGSTAGIHLRSMTPTALVIGNSNVAGANFLVTDQEGLQSVSGDAIYLNNVDNVTIDGLDVSYRATTRSGRGIVAETSSDNLTVKNVTVMNRQTGLRFDPLILVTSPAHYVTVQDSNFLNNDIALQIVQYNTVGSVTNNRIEGNSNGLAYSVRVGPTPASITLNATGNYWGAGGGGGPGEEGNNNVSGTPIDTSGFLNEVPTVLFRDYGDAPVAFDFYSRLVGFGARHIATGPMLGTNRDSEADTIPTTLANTDDTTGTPSDEDGVTVTALTRGLDATWNVFVSNGSGKLDAWIDFNHDGDWDDTGEKIANSVSLINGNNSVAFPVPINAEIGLSFARFRLSTAGALLVTGAATDGEVEDYQVTVMNPVTNQSPTATASASPNPTSSTTTNLSVVGADIDTGEPSLTYTWVTTGTPPAAVTFGTNDSNAAKVTTATFTKTGLYQFLVTATDPDGLTGTSAIDVTVDQSLTTIVVNPNPVSLNANAMQTFTGTANDQFDSPLIVQPTLTWSSNVGTITSGGVLTAQQTSGVGTVTASSGATSGTAAVTVTNHSPTATASASPNPTSSTTTNLSAVGADIDTGEPSLTYTWVTTGTPPAAATFGMNGSNAAKMTTATFTTTGLYHFLVTATDPGGLAGTSTIDVTVDQSLTTIVVNPNPVSLNARAMQTFTGTANDQFGSPLIVQPTLAWSSNVGTITTGGVLTAQQTSGVGTVTASSGETSGTAAVTVTNHSPTATASASPNPTSSTTTNLSAVGADIDTSEPSLTYTWVTTETPPAAVTFGTNGSNAAKLTTATFTKSGLYHFLVTATDPGGLTGTSAIDVTVDQSLTTIVVNPNPVSLSLNAMQTFTGTANDQFGNPLTVQPPLTWTTNVGTINSVGVLTARPKPGVGTVTARRGEISGSTAVTVVVAPSQQRLAFGSDTGRTSQPVVRVYDGTAFTRTGTPTPLFQISATATYSTNYRGGVRVAVGDLNGDGIGDIVTVPGRNKAPDIKIFSGVDGSALGTIPAAQTYGANYKLGVYVAVGDVTGDGIADIVVSQELGNPLVKVFRNLDAATGVAFSEYSSTKVFGDFKKFIGGATVAVGDVSGSTNGEIIVGSGPGMTTVVRVFSVIETSPTAGTLAGIRDIAPPVQFGKRFNHGVYVSVGDVFGTDGKLEILTGSGSGPLSTGAGSTVRVYNGTTGELLSSFPVFGTLTTVSNSPVRVAVRSGQIYAVQSQDGRSQYEVRRFNLSVQDGFFSVAATDPSDPMFFGGGLFIG